MRDVGHGGMGAFLSLERMPAGGSVCRDYKRLLQSSFDLLYYPLLLYYFALLPPLLPPIYGALLK